jgi:imidazolonepropionase
MKLLIINIHQLINVRKENVLLRGSLLADLPVFENAYLVIEDGIIGDHGYMHQLPANYEEFEMMVYDAKGATILPSWCDSHTHLVFAASRESEFVDKINGLTYAEIAEKGGGILNSADRLNHTSEEELYDSAWKRLKELISLGTGAIEIKSGYGLTVEGELKMLRVIQQLKKAAPIPIKASFLGAHTYPLNYKQNHQGYIDMIKNEMLPIIAKDELADYIDVFCETGFFNVAETKEICNAGKAIGLTPKIHANQLSVSGGVEAGVELGALSVDHLESMDDQSIQSLASSNTIGTLLPTAAYFLRMPYQPARELIHAGCAIAIASDYNPGSSPSGNMNTVVSMSCIQLKMLPEEAINAATINAAYAMGLEAKSGSITKGKLANLIFTKPISSLAYLPYAFGSNLIDKVMVKGVFQ